MGVILRAGVSIAFRQLRNDNEQERVGEIVLVGAFGFIRPKDIIDLVDQVV